MKIHFSFKLIFFTVVIIAAFNFYAQIKKVSASTVTSFVAMGDSNTTPWLTGTTSWYSRLESKIKNLYPTKTYQFTNLAVDGKSVTPLTDAGVSRQYDVNQALNNISHADIGFIMLGTNDAWRGIAVSDFQNYYKSMILTIKQSGKIEQLYILSVPPQILPYNCIGSTCWRNTHNPQTERVVPYNNFLSTIANYCTSIGFTCKYINSTNGILLNTTYLNAADGIHLLNTSQNIIATNIFNVVKTNTAITQVSNNFASFVSQDINTSLISGNTVTVRVSMVNNGLTNWTSTAGYKLNATVNGSIWGFNINLDPSEVINPGQQKDFIFNITAPKTVGNYEFKWRMVKGTSYFGDSSIPTTINVYQPRGATFISQSVPTTIGSGKTVPVSITLKNSGTINWSGDEGFGLGISNLTKWGVTRVYLQPGEIIAPGEQKTFTFNITAPVTIGTYYFKWRMLQEETNWFGSYTPNTAISVVALTNNSNFVSQLVPTTMVAGSTAEVSVTMLNTGTRDWKDSTKHKLGAIYNVWNTSRVSLLPTDIVETNETVTFIFTIQAPLTPGTYNFQYRMIQEGVGWFGVKTTLTPITVTPLAAGSINNQDAKTNLIYSDYTGLNTNDNFIVSKLVSSEDKVMRYY